ncbi:MAG: hypothetical protein QGG63_01985 [Candidatus Pacebacteria bacterium]|jgi:hypothetical protein|nr:hypothetical protein [Candidatus Paceibacterota bacterium]|tara:strand:+ start:11145 stop:11492 length:348 start_codon:yes stop_codon:yes gene_type:complete
MESKLRIKIGVTHSFKGFEKKINKEKLHVIICRYKIRRIPQRKREKTKIVGKPRCFIAVRSTEVIKKINGNHNKFNKWEIATGGTIDVMYYSHPSNTGEVIKDLKQVFVLERIKS